VVVDPAQFPKTFKEAPQLAELVKAGKLPPVAERIGQDPLVIKSVHEIGKYGGMWRRGFTGPVDFWNGLHCVAEYHNRRSWWAGICQVVSLRGKEGKEPTGRIREMMDLWVKGMGVSEEERLTLGKRIWQIAAEDVYIIGIIGPGAASGVRVAKVHMGNLPARMYISPDGKAESISRPVTYFYKN
jgi:hypothetical protein